MLFITQRLCRDLETVLIEDSTHQNSLGLDTARSWNK